MIISLIIGTVFFVFFVFLYLGAGDDITEDMLNSKIETQRDKLKKIDIEIGIFKIQAKEDKAPDKKNNIKKAKALKNKRTKAEKLLYTYEKKKVMGLDLIPVAGYSLVKLMKWDMKNKNIKMIYGKCIRFKERKEAINYTKFVFGNLFGNIILGFALALAFTGVLLAMNMGIRSAFAGVVIFMLFGVLGYLPYDEVRSTVSKRNDEIENDFLQVVSQLTLLVSAGMEVNRAWRISSGGGYTTLYEEMKRVNIDIDNGISYVDAYSKFITRCGNKFTTRLATAISQNMTKGNAEIVNLFNKLNSESWSEYRHSSRRITEKLQSKLFIPTMLMFVGILILVILPIMTGFNL